MKKQKLSENSNLETAPIVYGAWGIGGPPFWDERDRNLSIKTIQTALDLGVNMIDTAPIYGFGRSEEIVGDAIKNRRDDLLLATKLGLRWKEENLATMYHDLSAKSVVEELENSLRRLATDHIDLYQIHCPDPDTPIDETMAALVKLQEQGKIVEIGVSNFDVKLLEAAQKITQITCVQPQYSLLVRDIESSLLPYMADKGIGSIVYSPLASGLLTGKYDKNSTFTGWRGRGKLGIFQKDALAVALEKVAKLKNYADEVEIPLTHLALRWVVAQKGVSAAIVGANTPEQVTDNVKAFSRDIPEAIFSKLLAF